MKLRTVIGLVLMLAGAGLILWGLSEALGPLVLYYSQSLDAPMSQPDDAERKLSAAMLRGVKLGAIGAVPMLVGSFMLQASIFQKLRGRKRPRGSSEPRA